MTSEFEKIEQEQRHAERLERQTETLRCKPGRCAFCGEDYPRNLEYHHLSGRANSDETILVCRNCHGRLSDAQEDWPNELLAHQSKSPNERYASALCGVADALELSASKIREVAADLLDHEENETI